MRDLLRGMRLLGQGQRWAYRHRRDWRFGMIPALITLAGYAAVLAVLVVWGPDLVGWATPFADHWAEPWRDLFRGGLDVLLFCGGLLLAVVSFTAVTLLVGQPFYEALAARVDRAEGDAPEPPELPLWRELWISARDSLFLLVRVAAFGVLLFAAGFLPVVGQTAVPAAGFCVSGFFLTVELAGVAFQRREVPLRDRLALLRGRLTLTLGFGVPLVLAFLVPFVAVVLMPGAVAGATLLTRELVPPVGALENDSLENDSSPAAPGPGDPRAEGSSGHPGPGRVPPGEER